MNGLWEPIPYGETLSQPRYMGEDLGPTPNYVTNLDEPHGRPHPTRGVDGPGEMVKWWGEFGRQHGRGTGIYIKYDCFNLNKI